MTTYEEAFHWTYVHQVMLADRVRMRRLRRALTAVIRPGDVVADVGAGTAVLAMLACRAGAKRVYAIEHNPVVYWLANRLVRGNGLADRVCLIEGKAQNVTLPEPVDVIVSETIGNFGTDEGIYETMQPFASRHLKPEGRIIPARLQTYLVPVQYQREFRGVWDANYMGLDLRAAADFPAPAAAVLHFLRRRPVELGRPALVEDVCLGRGAAPRPNRLQITVPVRRAGYLQGFVGYFVATLASGITLSNYPCYPGSNWNTWNWPVAPPLAVTPGQRLRLALTLGGHDSLDWRLSWQVEVTEEKGRRLALEPDAAAI